MSNNAKNEIDLRYLISVVEILIDYIKSLPISENFSRQLDQVKKNIKEIESRLKKED